MKCSVERCSNCPFKTPCIGTKGPVDSPFVIVGESPGTNELRQGKPFVGESGLLLNSVLKQAGLAETGIEPFVINALSCYPPPKAKDGDSTAMQQATRACQPRLIEALQKHPRKVILCLGAAASWSVTNDFGIKITQVRGEIRNSPYADHVVLAVHPAFLMRQGGGLPFWKKDLARAVKLLKGEPRGVWSEPTWSLIEKPSEIMDLVDRVAKAEYVTGDLETDQLHWFANPNHSDPNCRGRILCEGITMGDGSHVEIIPEHVFYTNLELMRKLHAVGRWSWHNSLFDVTWLRAPQHKIHAVAHIDTMLMSYAKNENRGFHGLDQVAQYLIGAPPHKGMLEKYLPSRSSSYRLVPSEVLYKYNAIDLSKQHQIYPGLRHMIDDDPHSKKLYDKLLIPAVEELVRMKLHGVKVDRRRVEENEQILERQLKEFDDKINEYAAIHIGAPINVGSPQQLAGLLYDKMGLKIPGTRSTDEDTIIQLQRRYDHPIFNLILNRRELAKTKGTYVTNLLCRKKGKRIFIGEGHIKPDGCVYPDFKLHGTTTGRLAGSDPNLLNQPRGALIRGQYVARPGKLFVEVDENQAELRSLAVMSGDKKLLEIYTENKISIHDVTTGAFYGTLEQMTADPEVLMRAIHQLQYFGEDRSPKKVYSEAKMRGKAVNFGIVYGREAYSLAMEFNISVKEAQRWIDLWFETYPEAAAFIKWCRSRPLEKKDLITAHGRRKRHGVVSRERLHAIQNEAANFPHQATASDIMLETVIESGPVLRERWDAHCWNEVYDAVYFEIDIDEKKVAESIDYVSKKITEIPLRYGIDRVPFLGDAKVGFDWGHMEAWKGSIEATLGKEVLDQYIGVAA